MTAAGWQEITEQRLGNMEAQLRQITDIMRRCAEAAEISLPGEPLRDDEQYREAARATAGAGLSRRERAQVSGLRAVQGGGPR